jgi:hypothetical protein
MSKAVGKYQFDELLASQATIHNVHCLQLTNVQDTKMLTICSYATDANRALFVACPQGGATVAVKQTLRHEAGQLAWKATTGHMHLSDAFVVHAKRTEWTSSTATMVADKLQLQSSVDPFELHSFSTQRQGLALRCPKGGVAVTSGPGGILASTGGNVDVVLDAPHTHLRLAARGHKKHTIHLGNDASETVVANQLTVRGKLVLNDDSVIEKHVTTVRELQNVVRLACHDAGDTAYDYGFVSAGPHNTQSGLVYDHQRDRFYFSTRLGAYANRRFALPQTYADVQARVFLAQQKVHAPFVEASTVQCRSVRHPTELTLQAPRVQCAQRLASASVHADVVQAHTQTTTPTLVVGREATVEGTLATQTLRVAGDLDVGGGAPTDAADALRLTRWLWNTVGPHGRHRTLQDFLDRDDEAPDTDARGKAAHAVFEATTTPHNCHATVDRRSLVLDGRHALLTGTLELAPDCESLLIVDARLSQFTLTSVGGDGGDASPKDARAHPVSIVLRNVHGDAKDWAFALPEGRLTFEQCDIEFQNQVLGTLERVLTTQSTIRGTPWRQLVCAGQ